MEFDSLIVLFILLVIAFAGLVHGTLGLGFPMIATPFLALFMDVQSAILVTLFPTVAVNIGSIMYGGRWRESIGRYWPLALFAVIGSILGTRFLIESDPAPFRLLLAGIILVYLNVERLGRLPMGWIKNYPLASMAVFGIAGGFLAGTVNVMVPLLVIFALELGLEKRAMIQVFNLCFLAGKLSQIGVFAASGLLEMTDILDSMPVVITAILALVVGIGIRKRIKAELYRKMLKRLLLVVSCVLIGEYFLMSG